LAILIPHPAKLLQRGNDSALSAPAAERSIAAMTGIGPAGFAPRFANRIADEAEHREASAPAGPQQSWRSVVMQVRHILHGKGRDVVAVSITATIQDAAKLLTEKRIGALVVQDKSGVLTGIISERDLVQAIAEGGSAALAEQVGDHMTAGPETCVETDTVETLMEVMTRGRFRHVPVLDDDMRLCGMISIGDVVKTRIAETVSEAAALRDYISATA
jgi:CBS domain-containing protein